MNRDLIRRIIDAVNGAPDIYDTSHPGTCIVDLMYGFSTSREEHDMPQYVTITGDDRFAGRTDVHLIPGLHGVGLVDGRKVSIVTLNREPHAVPSEQVELWTGQASHPASGLRYESSDRGGYRIISVNLTTGHVRVLSRIAGTSEGSPEETELYRTYNVRVLAAIEALGED